MSELATVLNKLNELYGGADYVVNIYDVTYRNNTTGEELVIPHIIADNPDLAIRDANQKLKENPAVSGWNYTDNIVAHATMIDY